MSEQASKPLLSLNEVVRAARIASLEDGYHLPTMIADGSRQSIVARLEQLAPTHEERAQQLFLLGTVLAERSDLGVLQQAFFITEAWLSVTPLEQPPYLTPAQDPQRREILAIAQLTILPPRTAMVILAMQRDRTGRLIQLKADPPLASNHQSWVESPLLAAFATGFLGSSLKPDD